MFRSALICFVAAGLATGLAAAGAVRPELESAVQAILAVGPEGEGNEAAGKAWSVLATAAPEELALLFRSLDGASPVQSNYLRSAIEASVERVDAAKRDTLATLLRNLLGDRTRSVPSRNLAYEVLGAVAPGAREALLPGMLEDPSEFLRRDAVQRLLEQAKAAGGAQANPDAARPLLQEALQHARDVEQVRDVAQRLEKMGAPVDLPRHFGFLTHWQVIGPFDNTKREGFACVEPPETVPDLSKTYPGKHGPVTWKPWASGDAFGKVDFNEALGMEKEVLAYALAEFESDAAREVELRLGTKNAWKLWLNGKLLFERDEYHRGQKIDQYRIKAALQPGKNLILMKACQDEQTQAWTVEWEFQLRVCDATGTAVLAKNRLPTPPRQAPRRRPAPAAASPAPASVPVPAATQPK